MNDSLGETIKVGSKKKSKIVHCGIRGTKEFTAFVKETSERQAVEFAEKTSEELKELISQALMTISEETDKVHMQQEYIDLKEKLKAFNDALNDYVKPHNAAIKFATMLLNERKAALE